MEFSVRFQHLTAFYQGWAANEWSRTLTTTPAACLRGLKLIHSGSCLGLITRRPSTTSLVLMRLSTTSRQIHEQILTCSVSEWSETETTERSLNFSQDRNFNGRKQFLVYLLCPRPHRVGQRWTWWPSSVRLSVCFSVYLSRAWPWPLAYGGGRKIPHIFEMRWSSYIEMMERKLVA